VPRVRHIPGNWQAEKPTAMPILFFVLLTLVVLGGAGFAVYHFTRKHHHRHATAAAAPPAPKAKPVAAGPSEQQAVTAIAGVITFGEKGRALALRGDYAGALAKRKAELKKLNAVQFPSSLKASVGFLTAALQNSVKADQARVACKCGKETPDDVAATKLKQQFLTGFNPFATKYLHKTFKELQL
jgi:hypothetical protein